MTEKTWLRHEGESGKAYLWFTIYRDMGYNRTLQNVVNKCKELHKHDKSIPTPTLDNVKNLSSIHDWVKRSIAFDNYTDEQARLHKEQHYKLEEQLYLDTMTKLRISLHSTIEELKLDEKARPTSKAHALKSISQALDTTFKDLRLASGKSTENTSNNVTAELEANTTNELTADINIHKILTDDTFLKQELEFMNKLIQEDQ